MADASPNSTKNLEIVELVDESKELGTNGEEPQGNQDKHALSLNHPEEPSIRKTCHMDDDFHESDTSATDSKSIRSRVFVGHLNTDQASRHDLHKLFSECGKVVAISLLSGYGFVQFDNEESARKSIDTIHGTLFFGMKLVVDKPAAWKKLDGENPKDPKPWPKDPRRPFVPEYNDHHRSERRRDRQRDNDSYQYNNIPPRYQDPYYERYLEMRYMEERLAEKYCVDADRYYDRYHQSNSRYPEYRQDYRSDFREHHRYAESRGYEPSYSRYDRPRDDNYDRRRPFDSYYH